MVDLLVKIKLNEFFVVGPKSFTEKIYIFRRLPDNF